MDRNDDGIRTDGHPENTGRELHMQPGRLEDIENATAYANRTGQHDITGEMPEGRRTPEGERQAQTGGGAGRATPGEDIGNGVQARPADGLEGADGHIERGEDIGNGIRARRADEQSTNNPLV